MCILILQRKHDEVEAKNQIFKPDTFIENVVSCVKPLKSASAAVSCVKPLKSASVVSCVKPLKSASAAA